VFLELRAMVSTYF